MSDTEEKKEESQENEEIIMDVPPDLPSESDNLINSEIPEETPETTPEENSKKEEDKEDKINVSVESKNEVQTEVSKEPSIPKNKETKDQEETQTEQVEENKDIKEKKLPAQANISEEVVEVRELEFSEIGLKEIDTLFKKGIPNICNILFVGEMSTGKTISALKLILATAKKGQKAIYLSLQDSEEKIINILKSLDKDIINYLNSGNIQVKKLDIFNIIKECNIKRAELEKNVNIDLNLESSLSFVEAYNPNLIVVDSLSALELGFSDDKMCYRHYIDCLFKYFEKIGVRAIYIKELVKEEELHKEFFENILVDCILFFKSDKKGKKEIKLIKEYPVPSNTPKKKHFLF